jgi:hypothetical protein
VSCTLFEQVFWLAFCHFYQKVRRQCGAALLLAFRRHSAVHLYISECSNRCPSNGYLWTRSAPSTSR